MVGKNPTIQQEDAEKVARKSILVWFGRKTGPARSRNDIERENPSSQKVKGKRRGKFREREKKGSDSQSDGPLAPLQSLSRGRGESQPTFIAKGRGNGIAP